MDISFDSVAIPSNTYAVNTTIDLVASTDPNKRKIVKNIVCLNTDATESAVVKLKLGNAIILTQTLAPGEYINYQALVVVSENNSLSFETTNPNVDVNILMVMEVTKTVTI